jgi:DNA (cytosine-5)-methyltransferase 1
MDKGFKMANFDIIWATDISEGACLTYSKNISNHIVQADITELDLEKTPKAPFLIGGSPCVKYSNSNRKTNINKQLYEAERILDIPDNILLRKYIESVKINDECLVFVHENVGQINTIGDGKLLEEIREELPDFELTTGIVNAVEFGPQERKRSIIIGSKIGKIEIPRKVVHACSNVRDAFKGLNDSIPNQKDFSKAKPLTLERMQYIGQGENVFAIPEEIRPSGQHSDYYKRLEWDKPSITIVNPRKSMILHPEENRILSVRECARLQGLDDDFVFYGSLESKQQQVCNGVQVGVAYAIATKIKEYVSEYLGSKHQDLALSI